MKILFFSDFHFDSEEKTSGISIDYPTPVVDDPSMNLIEYLKDRYSRDKISFIIFLGDYVNGKNSQEEKSTAYNRIKAFATKIENECADIFEIYQNADNNNLKHRIIFIDGNHDISREGEHHSEFEKKFGEYLTPFTTSSESTSLKYNAPVFDFPEMDTQIACISTTQNAGAHYAHIDFTKLKTLLEPLKPEHQENHAKILELLQTQLSVDIGTVTSNTITQFGKNANTPRKINIVCSNHPLIPMQHETASHFETVNGVLFFDIARARGFTLFISGHLHEFYCVDISSREKSSTLPSATIISVPGFITPRNNEQCFVELEIKDDGYICKLLVLNKIRYRLEESDIATNAYIERNLTRTEHTLLDFEIQELIQTTDIMENASTDRINAISYDCALGLYYKRYDPTNNGWPKKYEKIEADENISGPAKIHLEPGEKVLLYTHEKFKIPKDMYLQASPRASWIRKGIKVDLSFIVEPGFNGEFCFPVVNENNHPIEINAQDAIMSIVFHQLPTFSNEGWSERRPSSKDLRLNRHDQ